MINIMIKKIWLPCGVCKLQNNNSIGKLLNSDHLNTLNKICKPVRPVITSVLLMVYVDFAMLNFATHDFATLFSETLISPQGYIDLATPSFKF